MANVSRNTADHDVGYLMRQATLILALATFAWCMIQETDITISIFRTMVVYLVGSIITYWVSNMMFKAKRWAEHEELKALQAAKAVEQEEREKESTDSGESE